MNIELNVVFIFGFGLFFLVYGISSIIRKQASFRYGRGLGSLPLKLTGTPAVISGFILLFGGMLMVIPIVVAYTTDSVSPDDQIINIAGVAGLIVVFVGLGLGMVIQVAINLGDQIGKKARRKK